MNTPRPSRQIMRLDSLEGPALPLSAAEVDRMASAIAGRAASVDGVARSGPRRRLLPGGLRWRVAVGVAIVTGSAAALHWIPGRHTQTLSKGAAVQPGASVLVPGSRVVEGPRAVPPALSALEPVSSARSLDTGPSGSPSGTRGVSAERSSVPARLLAHANELRRAQLWAPATAIYERIIREFPASAEAYSAKVAAASLRLEKLGDPATARQLYRQALRSPGSGALDEEILWGLGRADRAAGDPRAERATLERLLAEHPQSRHAPSARARLRQLAAESE